MQGRLPERPSTLRFNAHRLLKKGFGSRHLRLCYDLVGRLYTGEDYKNHLIYHANRPLG
jgi:hypothetical protein